jgi:uncharacterized tellurite resistance protein B-like protein
MAWLDRLLGGGGSQPETGSAAVRRIAEQLAALPPPEAKSLAAFAFLLGRVAFADDTVSAAESARMEQLVAEVGKVPPEQAVLVVEIAKAQNRLFGHTENFQVSRELRDLTDDAQRRRLLDCLFAVSAAEDGISSEEESVVRQIASELGFSHGDYVTARAAWSEHRTVLRGLKRGDASGGG